MVVVVVVGGPTCLADIGVGELFTSECRDEKEDAFELWCPFWRALMTGVGLVSNVTVTGNRAEPQGLFHMRYHSPDNWPGELPRVN